MREFFISYKGLLTFFIIGTLIFGGLTAFLIYKEKTTTQNQVSLYQKQIEQLDFILATLKVMPQSLNPQIKQDQFERNKINVENHMRAVKEAFAKGDIADARKKLVYIKASIDEFGNPHKNKFIPKEIRDKIDPHSLVLKRTDSIDPTLSEQYLAVVKIELTLLGK